MLAMGSAAVPASDRKASSGEAAIGDLKRLVLAKATRCDDDHGTITYVGPTDATLVACLEKHAKAKSLRITSLGGPVIEAIAAARIVGARSMVVTVAGFCGSSCGNYIAAAAGQLDVLEDSVIMLHGAPLTGAEAQRGQVVEALEQAGIAEEQFDKPLFDRLVAELKEQRALHDRFVTDFAVGPEWYALTAYYRAQESKPEEVTLLIVSPDFARACLGHPKIGSFWRAETPEQRDHMRQLLGGELMFMGPDLPTPASCN
jgi:hypothetical protein